MENMQEELKISSFFIAKIIYCVIIYVLLKGVIFFMYTFKVIDSKTDLKKVSKDGFVAQKQLMGGETVLAALKTIRKADGSCFVSLSKDFMKVAESTNVTKGDYSNKREAIVVIKGYDSTKIKVKAYYENMHSISDVTKVPAYAMEKLVLDCSREESIRDLASRGVVNARNTSYVTKEDGVLVYNHVKSEDIVSILDPIQIDTLYALMSDYGVNDNNVTAFINMVAPFISKKARTYGLTKSEEVLFNAMFVEKKNLTTIVDEIIEQNKIQAEMIRREDDNVVSMPDLTKDIAILSYEEDFDLLNVISYLKNKKRIILDKIFTKCGFKVSDIRIVEDKLDIARLGKVYHDKDVTITYNGVELVIPPQSYIEGTTYYNCANVQTAFMCGDVDMLVDNKESLENAYKIELEKNKGLKKTPNC